MDYQKIVNNIDTISGIGGLKKVLGFSWCNKKVREIVYKKIINKYGQVLDENQNAEMIKYLENKSVTDVSDPRQRIAEKLNIPINKIKIREEYYLIFGEKYDKNGNKL